MLGICIHTMYISQSINVDAKPYPRSMIDGQKKKGDQLITTKGLEIEIDVNPQIAKLEQQNFSMN